MMRNQTNPGLTPKRLTDLVERAKNRDQQALTDLYQESYYEVFWTVQSMVKDEGMAQDIMQDTYIKAFDSLDLLQNPASFIPWLRRIAVNRATDQLRRQSPVLFSQMEDEEGNGPEFRDLNPAVDPADALDREETARLVRGILDTLSPGERAAVSLFYYEQIPVREIAARLGTTENNVKVQLHNGRKKIKRRVEDYEKQGVKLYGLAPLPFFVWLLKLVRNYGAAKAAGLTTAGTAAAPTAAAPAAAASGKALGAYAAAAPVRATAKAGLAAFFAAHKLAAAAAVIGAVAVIGGTTTAVVVTNQNASRTGTIRPAAAVYTQESSLNRTEESSAFYEPTSEQDTWLAVETTVETTAETPTDTAPAILPETEASTEPASESPLETEAPEPTNPPDNVFADLAIRSDVKRAMDASEGLSGEAFCSAPDGGIWYPKEGRTYEIYAYAYYRLGIHRFSANYYIPETLILGFTEDGLAYNGLDLLSEDLRVRDAVWSMNGDSNNAFLLARDGKLWFYNPFGKEEGGLTECDFDGRRFTAVCRAKNTTLAFSGDGGICSPYDADVLFDGSTLNRGWESIDVSLWDGVTDVVTAACAYVSDTEGSTVVTISADGTVRASGNYADEILAWGDLSDVAMTVSGSLIVGLKPDGTLRFTGPCGTEHDPSAYAGIVGLKASFDSSIWAVDEEGTCWKIWEHPLEQDWTVCLNAEGTDEETWASRWLRSDGTVLEGSRDARSWFGSDALQANAAKPDALLYYLLLQEGGRVTAYSGWFSQEPYPLILEGLELQLTDLNNDGVGELLFRTQDGYGYTIYRLHGARLIYTGTTGSVDTYYPQTGTICSVYNPAPYLFWTGHAFEFAYWSEHVEDSTHSGIYISHSLLGKLPYTDEEGERMRELHGKDVISAAEAAALEQWLTSGEALSLSETWCPAEPEALYAYLIEGRLPTAPSMAEDYTPYYDLIVSGEIVYRLMGMETGSSEQPTAFQLLDLNNDGVKELIALFEEDDRFGYYAVYSLVDGVPKRVFEGNHVLECYPKSRILRVGFEGQGFTEQYISFDENWEPVYLASNEGVDYVDGFDGLVEDRSWGIMTEYRSLVKEDAEGIALREKYKVDDWYSETETMSVIEALTGGEAVRILPDERFENKDPALRAALLPGAVDYSPYYDAIVSGEINGMEQFTPQKFLLLDLNRDGVKEVIVLCNDEYGFTYYRVYTLVDGEPTMVLHSFDVLDWYPEAKILHWAFNSEEYDSFNVNWEMEPLVSYEYGEYTDENGEFESDMFWYCNPDYRSLVTEDAAGIALREKSGNDKFLSETEAERMIQALTGETERSLPDEWFENSEQALREALLQG